jgi:hypothetical protein
MNFSESCRWKVNHWFSWCHWGPCSSESLQTRQNGATSAAIQNSVPHPTCSLNVALSGFWLFAALKKHLRRIHFTCDEDVKASAGKWFWEQPKISAVTGAKTCSMVATYWTCRRLHGKMRYRNKLPVLGYGVCFVSFQYISWEERYKHGGITFQKPCMV